MSIFFPPVPPVHVGGAQPYAPKSLNPSIEAIAVNNPPFADRSFDPAQRTIISLAWQPDPWVYAFQGGAAPFSPRHLPLIADAIPVNNPPFGIPPVWLHSVVSAWQPSTWPYYFIGSEQPYEARTLTPVSIAVAVNNPPFRIGEHRPENIATKPAWQPEAWPFSFMGSGQPYTGYKLSPITEVVPANNPPFRTPEQWPVNISIKATEWTPDPWIYAPPGGSQPYAPRRLPPVAINVEIDNPPFQHRGRWAGLVNVVHQWQPDPWPPFFMGGRQAYSYRLLTPSIIDVAPTSFQLLRNVIVRARYLSVPTFGGYAERTFDPADPGESQNFGFDMTNTLLAGDTVSSATCSLIVQTGDDPSPSSHLIGSVGVVGNIVLQRVADLVAGVTYTLQFVVMLHSGSQITVFSHIPCQEIY